MNHIQFQLKLSMPKYFEQFGTKALCAAILERTRGLQGYSCSHCGEIATWYAQGRSHNTFQCPTCRHQTSLILGALFQNTKLPLTIWFLVFYLISQARTGLSLLALKRQLGVSYPSAWLFKFKHMQTMAEREALYALCGSVQVNNAYLGGEHSNVHKITSTLEAPSPFVLSPSATLRRALSKDEFAEIIVCTFLCGSTADCGSKNKVCFVAAVAHSDEGHPLHVKLTPVAFCC